MQSGAGQPPASGNKEFILRKVKISRRKVGTVVSVCQVDLFSPLAQDPAMIAFRILIIVVYSQFVVSCHSRVHERLGRISVSHHLATDLVGGVDFNQLSEDCVETMLFNKVTVQYYM